MGESADALPFSVANILKVDLLPGFKKPRQSSCNASKALTLAERLADVIMEAKNNAEGGGQKRRRTRTAFSQYQLTTLENTFSHNHYPDVVMREQLRTWTSLPDSTIQIWFKNRRAKFRKKKRTCIFDQGVEDSKSAVLPVGPVHCQEGVPSWSPLLPPQDTAVTTMENQLPLPSKVSLTSSWKLT